MPKRSHLPDGVRLRALAKFAADASHCPEARELAARLVLERETVVHAGHRVASVNLARVKADIAGLSSLTWTSPTHYASRLCDEERAMRRPREYEEALIAAQEAARASRVHA